MSTTPLLNITELEASQAQPELVVNKALRILEAVSPLQCLSASLTAPPGSPADGDRYIPASGATGAWINQDQKVAVYIGTAWYFIDPIQGWTCYDHATDTYLKYVAGSPIGWETWP